MRLPSVPSMHYRTDRVRIQIPAPESSIMDERKVDYRPLGVTIIGYLYIIGALFFLIAAVVLFLDVIDEALIAEYLPAVEPLMNIIIGAMIIGGASMLGIGLLFLNGFKIGYYIVLVLQIFSLIGDIIDLSSSSLGSILISLIIIFYLFKAHVKYWFGV